MQWPETKTENSHTWKKHTRGFPWKRSWVSLWTRHIERNPNLDVFILPKSVSHLILITWNWWLKGQWKLCNGLEATMSSPLWMGLRANGSSSRNLPALVCIHTRCWLASKSYLVSSPWRLPSQTPTASHSPLPLYFRSVHAVQAYVLVLLFHCKILEYKVHVLFILAPLIPGKQPKLRDVKSMPIELSCP